MNKLGWHWRSIWASGLRAASRAIERAGLVVPGYRRGGMMGGLFCMVLLIDHLDHIPVLALQMAFAIGGLPGVLLYAGVNRVLKSKDLSFEEGRLKRTRVI